ncbi:glycyl radical protein [Clostridium aminobutyricum]|uniref:Glycyl radical protein n=1 Tax=Clostridium aminobutyricum TaxID=33953 RepID=A0A939II52_CLOAM|nr:glycyl radical protein [Clostridium aminobutyricum]MBN7774567.1 glycyl radical protein [Clostridium aminobutyricum]
MKTLDISNVSVSPRIQGLIDELFKGKPQVEWERAALVTESYKATENFPTVLRKAKALEHVLHNLPIVIRDNELVVGNLTKAPFSTQAFPEYSYKWLLDEFGTLGLRKGDVFEISEESKSKLREAFAYWDGKTVNELATQYMYPETRTAIEHNVFTVGNYYFNGVGHIGVDYAKVLKVGFNGIIKEATEEMEKSDKNCPDFIKKRNFLEAVIITAKAAIRFAQRFAELAEILAAQTTGARSQELFRIAQNCKNVPAEPAKDFYEAIQSFWFVQAIIQIESNGHSISPLRFDQYMYPYYMEDIKSNKLTKESAQELLDCLWIKFNDINKVRDEGSTKGFGGYPMFQNLIVGGQDKTGLDATNELSIACLEATEHTKLPQPSISIRVWNKSPDEFLMKAAEVSRVGLGMPAYYNDEVIIPALVSRGLTLEDARDYGIIGCVEPQKGGKTEGWHDAAFFNLARVMEIMLNDGSDNGLQLGPKSGDVTSFNSFDQLLNAYKEQMEYFVSLLANADNAVDLAHSERAPLPFLSSMVEDCIGRGKSVQEGGAIYNFTGPQGVGVANVADSMEVLKELVYDKKLYTIQQIKAAMSSNFEGVGTVTASPMGGITRTDVENIVSKLTDGGKKITLEQANMLTALVEGLSKVGSATGESVECARLINDINAVPKFGNDITSVDLMAKEVALTYCKEVEKHKNPRNGSFQPGLYPVSANVPMGSQTGATPDGRKAGEPLADGVSPISGRDVNGPTAAANSVAMLDHSIASNGTLFNQKFHPSALSGQSGLEKLSALVRGFFDQKGMHVQYNVVGRETLLEAQKNPEAYKNLVVRVAGYSAHFVALDKTLQDDIIARTEQVF